MTDQELAYRIRLAEARGWTNCYQITHQGGKRCTRGYRPDRKKGEQPSEVPDPFTDANDCNALIKHLNGLGYVVKVEHYLNGAADVGFQSHEKETWWSGDNWMHGVCELALKVIATDEEGQKS